jgi:hypothetical protein
MEPLWSPVVATGGNQRQIDCVPNRQKEAKSVATGSHRLRETIHGKGFQWKSGGGSSIWYSGRFGMVFAGGLGAAVRLAMERSILPRRGRRVLRLGRRRELGQFRVAEEPPEAAQDAL